MVELKDFIHFHIGCEMLVIKTGDIISLDDIHTTGRWPVWTRNKIYCDKHSAVGYGFSFKQIKLILRPLPTMTDSERENAIEPMTYGLKTLRGIELHLQAAELIKYLCKRGFNVFDPKWEYCIDKSTVKVDDSGYYIEEIK